MNRKPPQLDADWTVDVLLDACPQAAGVLVKHGMACVGCVMARFETLVEVAREYHLDAASLLDEVRDAKGES